MASTGLILAGALGAGGALGSGLLQSNAASNAQNLQYQEWLKAQQNAAPYLKGGANAFNALAGGLTTPVAPDTTGSLVPTSLNQAWATPFQAPTAAQAAATPGEQFQMAQGENAIQNSAAAQGNLLSGSTLKGMEAYGQGLASTYYQQAYQNALQNYMNNYNIFQANQANQYNRLAGVAGMGASAMGAQNALGAQSTYNIGGAGENAAYQAGAGILGATNSLGGAFALRNFLNTQQNPAASTNSAYTTDQPYMPS